MSQLVGGLVWMVGPLVVGGVFETFALTTLAVIGSFGALLAGW